MWCSFLVENGSERITVDDYDRMTIPLQFVIV